MKVEIAFAVIFLALIAYAFVMPWEETICRLEPVGPGHGLEVEGYLPHGVDIVKTEDCGLCFRRRVEEDIPNNGVPTGLITPEDARQDDGW